MTDLEITRACAEAMSLNAVVDERVRSSRRVFIFDVADSVWEDSSYHTLYEPLRNDAQAMALVKKFKLNVGIGSADHARLWSAHWIPQEGKRCVAHSSNLNRAICECIAKMQATKK